MEELYKLLRAYNIDNDNEQRFVPWAHQFTKSQFPKYWGIVFDLLSRLDRNLRVIEVGCGLGDITAILCYLQYQNVTSFEKDNKIAKLAQKKIHDLFGYDKIIRNDNFPTKEISKSDLLILVNCAYKDCAKTKQNYIDLMKHYYECAGSPKYFLMEVIDSSYTIIDDEFPEYIRLSRADIEAMFPNADIKEWQTYVYPVNLRSKTLYLIERL